jgi:hypothetical protein
MPCGQPTRTPNHAGRLQLALALRTRRVIGMRKVRPNSSSVLERAFLIRVFPSFAPELYLPWFPCDFRYVHLGYRPEERGLSEDGQPANIRWPGWPIAMKRVPHGLVIGRCFSPAPHQPDRDLARPMDRLDCAEAGLERVLTEQTCGWRPETARMARRSSNCYIPQ